MTNITQPKVPTTTPLVLAVDINGIEACLQAAAEIAFVPIIKGGGIMNYAGLADDVFKLLTNVKEAREEIKEGINQLEGKLLIENNLDEIMKKFKILDGKSKYGVESILSSVFTTADIIELGKTAFDDGAQIEDLQYVDELWAYAGDLWKLKDKIILEASDIQNYELEKIVLTLYGQTFRILKN